MINFIRYPVKDLNPVEVKWNTDRNDHVLNVPPGITLTELCTIIDEAKRAIELEEKNSKIPPCL